MQPSKQKNRMSRGVEALERRVLMAGDVSALLQGADLIVRGDADDNQIVISQPNPETIRITGLEETTVNGEKFVDLSEFSDDLRLLMQHGGADQVSIQGSFDVADDLRAHLGEGELLIEGSFGSVSIGDDLVVHKGAEGNVTIRNDVRIEGDASITANGEVSLVAGAATVPDFFAAAFDDSLNINNPYFPVVPGTKWTYKSEEVDEDTGEVSTEDIFVEVKTETRTIEGVEVRIVNDRVFKDGLLIEDTFDWYAQDNNGNVWYFGEDVTNNEYDDDGKLIETNHNGSWEAGVDGAQAGILMEAAPRIGHRYYQEFAPGNVLDQGEGLATDEKAKSVLGTLKNVFRTEEYSIVEPFGLANKLYAPGVGTIKEFDLDIEDDKVIQTTRLVSLTLNGKPVKQVVPTNGFEGVNADGRVTGAVEIDGETDILAKGAVILNGANLGADLNVSTNEEVILIDSAVTGNSSFSADTLSLKRVFADGTIRIGGRADVIVFESDIHSFKGRFGGAENDLIVRNSVFDKLEARGGAGRNTFDDLGGNDFGKLKLRQFIKV